MKKNNFFSKIVKNKRGSNTVDAIIITPLWISILIIVIIFLSTMSQKNKVEQIANDVSQIIMGSNGDNYVQNIENYRQTYASDCEILVYEVLNSSADIDHQTLYSTSSTVGARNFSKGTFCNIETTDAVNFWKSGNFIKFVVIKPTQFYNNKFTVNLTSTDRWSFAKELVYSYNLVALVPNV